jgi:hypothetical protein
LVAGFCKFSCPSCGYDRCVECKIDWHEGVTCDQYNQWREDNEQGDTRLNEYMGASGAKPCPKCGTGVVKSEGCNHMTCRCHEHFCYVCGDSIDGGDPYSHFQAAGACPLFDGQ